MLSRHRVMTTLSEQREGEPYGSASAQHLLPRAALNNISQTSTTITRALSEMSLNAELHADNNFDARLPEELVDIIAVHLEPRDLGALGIYDVPSSSIQECSTEIRKSPILRLHDQEEARGQRTYCLPRAAPPHSLQRYHAHLLLQQEQYRARLSTFAGLPRFTNRSGKSYFLTVKASEANTLLPAVTLPSLKSCLLSTSQSISRL